MKELFVTLLHRIPGMFYHPILMQYTTSYPLHIYPYQVTDPIPYASYPTVCPDRV